MKKGQVALETIMIFGLIIITLSVVVAFATREASQGFAHQQAQDAVTAIVRAADTVYALGPGSEQYVTVVFPGGFENATIQGRSINLRINIQGVASDFPARSLANLTGTLPQSRGVHRIKATALDSGLVELEQG
ncbi:hypothetical protein HY493_01325 [Candidatus Woesearchaeota archaeon]|nr:hypothetical protein [Candidatus Woesearchaeota archaeon]